MLNSLLDQSSYLDQFITGNAFEVLDELPNNFYDVVVTSPPYYKMREYNIPDVIGNEKNALTYMLTLTGVFRKCAKKLKKGGSLFIVISDFLDEGRYYHITTWLDCHLDSIYNTEDNLKLKRDIIWQKPNAMGGNYGKRSFVMDYEHVLWFTKGDDYFFRPLYEPLKHPKARGMKWGGKNPEKYGPDTYSGKEYDASKLEGRLMRSVWSIPTSSPKGLKHNATFPVELAERCIQSTCPVGGKVLDPFCGSGTTAIAALKGGFHWTCIDINSEFIKEARIRLYREIE